MAETDRRIVTLPYGEGLERSKGVMVINPTTFDDLRNVFQFDGKAQVRQGLSVSSVLVDDQLVDLDVTVMLEALRSEAASVGVGYNTNATTNREVWLNRMLIDGTSPIPVGLLGVLDNGVTFEPPIIIGADSNNKFFLAHDEPNPTSRLVTQIYDPQNFPQLTNLKADLDGQGQNDVFFRGVVRHLSYIFGWGYGNFEDPVRGDVVRVSNSGDSAIFEDFAFFEAGQQGETVMVCRSAGPTLMVFKETETYEIFGYSPDTFGIRLADSLFGAVGSRLAVSIAGTVFFWSTQGPRLTSGGPSVDIAVPLDIDGPDPATLVAESDPQDAFAAYDPRTRVVQFVWGRRVYALSIRDPNRPRWSYYELGERAQSSGLFFSTQSTAGGGGPPIGAPENLDFDEPASGTLTMTANPSDGETVKIDFITYTFKTVLTPVSREILIGANASETLGHFIEAINTQPGPNAGVDYTTNTEHFRMSAAAGVGDTMIVSDKAGEGFEGNGRELLETLANGEWDSPVTFDGIGQTATFIEIFIDNIDQIGAEDIDVLISTDGGATYVFSERIPADGLFPKRQKLRINLENKATGKKIQPLTDYKISLRYILGGQFSPGYSDDDPDLWDTPDFDSQGSTETTVDQLVLVQRTGENEGIWEVLDSDFQNINIFTEVPAGHELLDIEVFLEIQDIDEDPDNFTGGSRGDVLSPFALRAIYNASSSDYPVKFIDNFDEADPIPEPQVRKLNVYKMRFINAAQGKVALFVNELECLAGPDPPQTDGITSFNAVTGGLGGTVLFVNWTNAVTPTDPRNCPVTPPALHYTEVRARNATTGGPWATMATHGPFGTNHALFATFPITLGDVIRVAIRHRVKCFGGFLSGGRYRSEYSLEGLNRFVSAVATLTA